MTSWLRPTVRLRLTAVFAALFAVGSAVLLALNFFLVRSQLSIPVSIVLPTPLPSPSGTGDRLVLGFDDDPAMREVAERVRQDALAELARQSLLALVVMTLIALFVAWWVSGRIIRPISDITEAVRRITPQDPSARVALKGPNDELRALADTFDELLARIERATGLQRRLLANASHELRTPLANQRTIIDVALAANDPAAEREALLLAQSQNRRSQHIIDALFLLADVRSGTLDAVRIDLADVAAACLAEEDTDSVRIETDLAPAIITGDRRLVEILVSNLVRNAVAHNEPDGFVRVRTRDSSITIANSGPVIDETDLTAILEPFVRRGQRLQSKTGLGLGLPLVAEITRAHNADLRIEARSHGGLTATVVFEPTCSTKGGRSF